MESAYSRYGERPEWVRLDRPWSTGPSPTTQKTEDLPSLSKRGTIREIGSTSPAGFQVTPGTIGSARQATNSRAMCTTAWDRGGKAADRQVRVGIPAEQEELKDEHARRPDARRAAEPGENELPDQGLNLKQQKGGQENRERIERQGKSRAPGLQRTLRSAQGTSYPLAAARELASNNSSIEEVETIRVRRAVPRVREGAGYSRYNRRNRKDEAAGIKSEPGCEPTGYRDLVASSAPPMRLDSIKRNGRTFDCNWVHLSRIFEYRLTIVGQRTPTLSVVTNQGDDDAQPERNPHPGHE